MAYVEPPRDVSDYDPLKHGARCDLCPLAGNRYVPAMTPKNGGKPRLLIVGEGPGYKEEIQRRPFCLVPETLVLMSDLTWRPLGDMKIGDEILTVQEHPDAAPGVSGFAARKWEIATVTAKWSRKASTIKLTMESGRDLVGTPDHRVLTSYKKGSAHTRRWLPMSRLHATVTHDRLGVRENTRNSCIASIGAPWEPFTSHEAGWLAGFLDGEGHVHGSHGGMGAHAKAGVGFAQNLGPVADRACTAVESLGFKMRAYDDQRMYTGKVTRRVHIAGGGKVAIRFLGQVRPTRLLADFKKVISRVRIHTLEADGVAKKEPAGTREVIDITTTAGTFIANGYVVHNCGQSGAMLDDMLDTVGESRWDMYVTNAALCRGDTDKDNDRAAECCAPRLLKELEALPKDIPIVALGKAATRSILGVKSILLARGFVWTARALDNPVKAAHAAARKVRRARHPDPQKVKDADLRVQILTARHALAGRMVLPTVHPAFVLRADNWTPILRLDLDRAARIVSGRLDTGKLDDEITRVKSVKFLRPRTYIVTDNPSEIRRAAKLLGPTVAVDIETESADPLSPLIVRILCVQVSDGDRTFVIGPWDPRLHAEVLSEILSTRQIVMHNGYNFDQPALQRDGVVLRPEQMEDTLLAHHTFASHFPQRLDHVVSTFLDASPWKIRHGRRGVEEKGLLTQDMDPDELYHYGAVDAVLTCKAWLAMQADLADEMDVYKHDKELGVQAKGLQVGGFKVDRKRKYLLARLLKARAAALKGRMRTICKRPDFEPSRLGHVRRVLFTTLRAPMLNPTASGLASTSNATLETLKTSDNRAGRFSAALLDWRIAQKIRSTYVVAVSVHKDNCAHYNWRNFGTVSGRYSCRLQSAPRWSKAVEDRVREMYTADVGHDLWYFDLSQAEARFAANLSGDPVFIETCKGDVHSGNALILFPDAAERIKRDAKGKHCPKHGESGKGTCNCGKPFRDIAKNAGFAVAYLAEAPTVFAYLRAHGFPVELDAVIAMLDRLKFSYKTYYRYVEDNVAYCTRHGHLRTAITGRLRVFGYAPKPQEIANFPIQSGIADVMNIRSLQMQKQLPSGSRLVAQVHDACLFTVPKKHTEWVVDAKGYRTPRGPMADLIERTWAEPVRLKESIVCRAEREFMLPAEIKVGRRWSDFG